MDENLKELQRRLEQATTNVPGVDNHPSDPEFAEMRAAWLAFGELLDAREMSEPPDRPLLSSPCGSRRSHRSLLTARNGRSRPYVNLRVIGAVAASVVMATAAICCCMRSWNRTALSSTSLEVAVSSFRPAAPNEPSINVSPAPATLLAAECEIPWDDSFDQEIAQTRTVIKQVAQDWLVSVAGSHLIQYQFESARKGLEESPFE